MVTLKLAGKNVGRCKYRVTQCFSQDAPLRDSLQVKVKYQGHVSQKMGVSGALVFHKHILFFFVQKYTQITVVEKNLKKIQESYYAHQPE